MATGHVLRRYRGRGQGRDPVDACPETQAPEQVRRPALAIRRAVSETLSTLFDPTPHRTNVLFGSLKFMYGDALGPRWVRASDGIWRGPGAHPRNRRLAAVLFASQLTPWTVDQAELEWCDNPFANRPGPDEFLPDVASRRPLLPNQAAQH